MKFNIFTKESGFNENELKLLKTFLSCDYTFIYEANCEKITFNLYPIQNKEKLFDLFHKIRFQPI